MEEEKIISVSVLIAAYNEGKRISKCLDSLINQTLKNIQILCVNDASTDNTLEVLNQYAAKDSRIVVVDSTVNSRFPSKARNKALGYVKGQYITMIDADDYVDADYLEKAYKMAIETGADSVVNKHIAWNEPIPMPREEDFKTGSVITGKEALIACLDDWKIHAQCIWNMDLFADNYRFDESGMFGCEFSTIYLYSKCKTVAFANGVYYYCDNAASMTHQKDDRTFDLLNKQMKIRDLMKKNDIYEMFFHTFESRNLTLLKQYHYLYFKLRRQWTKEKNAEIKQLLMKFYNSFNRNDVYILETNKTPTNTMLNKIRFSSYTLFYCTAWILSKFVK